MDYRLKNGVESLMLAMNPARDDRLPGWINELARDLRARHGVFDQQAKELFKKALAHIHDEVLEGGEVTLPAPEPFDLEPEEAQKWFERAPVKRINYLNRGRNAYYDRMQLDNERDYVDACRVGASLEFRDVIRLCYDWLDERGLIDEMRSTLDIEKPAKKGVIDS